MGTSAPEPRSEACGRHPGWLEQRFCRHRLNTDPLSPGGFEGGFEWSSQRRMREGVGDGEAGAEAEDHPHLGSRKAILRGDASIDTLGRATGAKGWSIKVMPGHSRSVGCRL